MKNTQTERDELRRKMKVEGFICDECGEEFKAGTMTEYCRKTGSKLSLVCEDCGDFLKSAEEEEEFFGTFAYTGCSD